MTISTVKFEPGPENGRPGKKEAFTLAEILVAVTITAFLLTSAYAAIFSLAEGSQSVANYTEMNRQTRHSIELFGRDARMAADVKVCTREKIVLESNGEVITYEYIPSAGVFRRSVNGGLPRTLLYDVDELHMNYYTLRHAATNKPIEVKHVQLEAKMEWNLLRMVNTNYIISARFMMRNKDVSN